MAREKILVVGHDLDSLSKMYLALTHRNYKAEVCNKPGEALQRLRRSRAAVIILDDADYEVLREKLRRPAVVLTADDAGTLELNAGDVMLKKPVSADRLAKAVEQLT